MAADSDVIAQAVARIETLLGNGINLVSLFKDLRPSQGDSQPLESKALRAAVTYCFSRGQRDDEALPGPLIPLFAGGGSALPRPVSDTDDTWHQAWAAAAEVASHPALLARLHDLLWLVGYGDQPYRHAQSAFRAYLDAAEMPWSGSADSSDGDDADSGDVAATDYLRRARDLGREIRLPNADTDVADRAVAVLQAELALADAVNRPGIASRLFTLALECAHDESMPVLEECLERMRSLCRGDEWSADDLFRHEIRFARRFADPAEMRQLQERRARHWLTAARNAKAGLARLWRIQRASEIAERAGDSELIREVRAELDRLEWSRDDFHSASFEVELPAAEIRAVVAEIVGDDSLPNALCRLALLDPPALSEEGIRHVTDEMSSVFLDRIQINLLDEADRLVFAPSTPEERMQYKESQARQLRLSMFREALLEQALNEIRERHWTDGAGGELYGFFMAAWPDQWIADGLARAFLYWASGAGEETVVLALRRVERIIRDLLQECGGTAWVPPQPKAPGHAQGLGAMMRELRGHVDDSLWQYLKWTLSEPLGLNLRAKYFHALDATVPVPLEDATMVLQAVLYLWRDRIQRKVAAEAGGREDSDGAAV